MEGGQSATGGLLDHVIRTHPAFPALTTRQQEDGHSSLYSALEAVLRQLCGCDGRSLEDVGLLTADLHVLPDFHGNRSPLADPRLRGSVVGLSLAADLSSLALLYLATVQAISYGTKHIVQALEARYLLNMSTVHSVHTTTCYLDYWR
jgi:ribulose kinase